MKLHSITLDNFRGVSHRTIEFPDTGLTVVSGPNEIGKTSTIEAFDLLLEFKDNSGHKTIKSAQPKGRDVGPRVEAEMTIGDHRIRYRKQWLKDRTTHLEFLAGPRKGDVLTGGDAHNTATALWENTDATLFHALRLMQANALDQEKLTSSALLQEALNAQAGRSIAEDGPGESLLELARAEADKYYTSSRKQDSRDYGRVQSRYMTAVEARNLAEQRFSEIERQLISFDETQAEVDDAKAALARSRKQLADLESQEKEIADLRTEAISAQEENDRLVSSKEAVQAALAARAELKERADASAKAYAEAHAEEATATEDDAVAMEQEKSAETNRADARAKLDEAHEHDSRAQADVDYLTNKETLDADQKLLAELEAIRVSIAEVEPSSESRVTPELLRQIREAEREVDTTQAALMAGSTQIDIASLSGTRALTFNGEDHELTPANTFHRSLTEKSAITLGSEWSVTLHPGTGTRESTDKATTASARLSELLAAAGCESVLEAESELDRASEAARTIENLKQRRKTLLGDRSEGDIRDSVTASEKSTDAYLQSRGSDAPVPVSVQAAREAKMATADALNEARANHDRAQAAFETVNKAANERRESRAKLRGALVEKLRTKDSDEAALERARSQRSDEEIDHDVKAAEEALGHAATRYSVALKSLEAAGADIVEQELAAVRTEYETFTKQLSEARDRHNRADGALSALDRHALQRDLDKAIDEETAAHHDKVAWDQRASAALRLESTLKRHQEEAHRAYVEPFRRQIVELGRALEPNFDVRVGDDLKVTDRIDNGSWIAFDNLSSGAKEQLVILIRLATALLVDKSDVPPILLDDTFSYSDATRRRRLAGAFRLAGEHTQVILFTANKDRFAALEGSELIDISRTDTEQVSTLVP